MEYSISRQRQLSTEFIPLTNNKWMNIWATWSWHIRISPCWSSGHNRWHGGLISATYTYTVDWCRKKGVIADIHSGQTIRIWHLTRCWLAVPLIIIVGRTISNTCTGSWGWWWRVNWLNISNIWTQMSSSRWYMFSKDCMLSNKIMI